ncbi:MAG TPA: hypothetical protein VKV33_01510 [Streptosporangiaceae bacterium]|nr:hypothetical protein [Streptosporangiaceae bacterium]
MGAMRRLRRTARSGSSQGGYRAVRSAVRVDVKFGCVTPAGPPVAGHHRGDLIQPGGSMVRGSA